LAEELVRTEKAERCYKGGDLQEDLTFYTEYEANTRRVAVPLEGKSIYRHDKIITILVAALKIATTVMS
jgi:hypothetical protein